jgi:hypothetical protein
MQIDSKMNKTKRLLLVTETSLYCLRENFSTKVRIELKNISKVFLIKANSSVLALSQAQEKSNEVDILLETVKRTELFFFILNQFETFGWIKPKLLYSSAILVNKAAESN